MADYNSVMCRKPSNSSGTGADANSVKVSKNTHSYIMLTMWATVKMLVISRNAMSHTFIYNIFHTNFLRGFSFIGARYPT